MIIVTRPHDTHTLVSTWLLRFTSVIKMHRIRAVISSLRFVYWSVKWLQFLLLLTFALLSLMGETEPIVFIRSEFSALILFKECATPTVTWTVIWILKALHYLSLVNQIHISRLKNIPNSVKTSWHSMYSFHSTYCDRFRRIFAFLINNYLCIHYMTVALVLCVKF